jgi:Rad3-related DNA helicase
MDIRMMQFSEEELLRRKKRYKTLSFWCFNPGLGFRKITKLQPRTIILTSGTLSPMDSF